MYQPGAEEVAGVPVEAQAAKAQAVRKAGELNPLQKTLRKVYQGQRNNLRQVDQQKPPQERQLSKSRLKRQKQKELLSKVKVKQSVPSKRKMPQNTHQNILRNQKGF